MSNTVTDIDLAIEDIYVLGEYLGLVSLNEIVGNLKQHNQAVLVAALDQLVKDERWAHDGRDYWAVTD